jgi:hypothetical protein
MAAVTRNGFVAYGQDPSRRCRREANGPFEMVILILLNGRWSLPRRYQLPLCSGTRKTSGTMTTSRTPATTQRI